MTGFVIKLSVFIMGAMVMMVELLASKLLAPYFGSSLHVWGSILFIFMLALALGYEMGGRLSQRTRSLTPYGLLFVAASITLLPTLLFADAVMLPLFESLDDPRWSSLLASMILFFMPTLFMGMTAPYAVRVLTATVEESGRVSGLLNFIGTMGSAAGTLLTAFYLVLWFEIGVLIACAIVTLHAVGVCLICHQYMRRRRGAFVS